MEDDRLVIVDLQPSPEPLKRSDFELPAYAAGLGALTTTAGVILDFAPRATSLEARVIHEAHTYNQFVDSVELGFLAGGPLMLTAGLIGIRAVFYRYHQRTQ